MTSLAIATSTEIARVAQRANPADAHAQAISGGESQAERRTSAEVARSIRAAGASANDASRALLHGSEVCKPDSIPARGPSVAGTAHPSIRVRSDSVPDHPAVDSPKSLTPIGHHARASNPVVTPATLRLSAFPSTPLHVAIITFSLLFASSTLAQQPAAGPLDGSWIAELREARADLKEHRDAIRESAAEAKALRLIFERYEPRTWDGSKIGTFLSNLFAPFAWVVQIVKLAFYALIAVCVARSIRELSDAYTVWKVGRANP